MTALLFKNVRSTLPSLLVAALAVALAWGGIKIGYGWAAAAAAVVLLLGIAFLAVGDRQLRGNNVTGGVAWLERAILVPGAVAAAVGATLIIIGIQLAPPEDASAETKALLGAVGTAISTYFTTVFIKGADDADEGWSGSLVKGRLQRQFRGRFPEGSEARDAVFSDERYSGWGRDGRKKRAEVIQAALG
ncbi:MAG TPA: hypothetical protein VH475_15740 [Tepidisphaeraceae bacterium]|jgi:hypothetical protein